jgi:hypothetical protein
MPLPAIEIVTHKMLKPNILPACRGPAPGLERPVDQIPAGWSGLPILLPMYKVGAVLPDPDIPSAQGIAIPRPAAVTQHHSLVLSFKTPLR